MDFSKPHKSAEWMTVELLENILCEIREGNRFAKETYELLLTALPVIHNELVTANETLQLIAGEIVAPEPLTPTSITFQETSMLPPVAGNTLVFTGTLTPDGSAFPAGTTFTVTSSDVNVSASVDATGLVVTAVLGANFAAGENDTLDWASSTFTPSPDGSPSQLTATISITGQAAPVATPTGVTFAQTT